MGTQERLLGRGILTVLNMPKEVAYKKMACALGFAKMIYLIFP